MSIRRSVAIAFSALLAGVSYAGEKPTFGFEVEFTEGADTDLVTAAHDASNWVAHHFLDPELKREQTGNREVISIGGETDLAEVMEQMRWAKENLGSHAKVFHLRARFPKASVKEISLAHFQSWLTVLGDSIFAWRVRNRSLQSAFRQSTLRRTDVTNLRERGTLRFQILSDGSWDVEIRGYMTDLERIESAARLIVDRVANPKIPDEFILYRRHGFRGTPLEALQDWRAQHQIPPLSLAEQETLQSLLANTQPANFLPLHAFDESPLLAKAARAKYRRETERCFEAFNEAVVDVLAAPNDFSRGNPKDRLLQPLRVWVMATDFDAWLSELLKRNRPTIADEAAYQEFFEFLTQNWGESGGKFRYGNRGVALEALLALKSPRSIAFIRELYTSPHYELREHAIVGMFQHWDEPEFRRILGSIFFPASKTKFSQIREIALAKLNRAPDSPQLRDTITRLWSSATPEEKPKLLRNFLTRQDDASLELLKLALVDGSPSLERAISFQFTVSPKTGQISWDERVVPLFREFLMQATDTNLRRSVIDHLMRSRFAPTLPWLADVAAFGPETMRDVNAVTGSNFADTRAVEAAVVRFRTLDVAGQSRALEQIAARNDAGSLQFLAEITLLTDEPSKEIGKVLLLRPDVERVLEFVSWAESAPAYSRVSSFLTKVKTALLGRHRRLHLEAYGTLRGYICRDFTRAAIEN